MASLNIVNKSPFEKQSLAQCLSRISEGSSVLLIEDAVVAAVGGTAIADQLSTAAKKNINLYVLQPDLAARGFSDAELVDQLRPVDYPGFVNLVTEHERVHSWL